MFRSTHRSSTTNDATSLSSLLSFRLFFIFALLIGSSYIDNGSFSTNAVSSSSSSSSSSSTNNGGIHNNNNNNKKNDKKMPNLPFGDINVVVLTDLHSWVSTIIYWSSLWNTKIFCIMEWNGMEWNGTIILDWHSSFLHTQSSRFQLCMVLYIILWILILFFSDSFFFPSF